MSMTRLLAALGLFMLTLNACSAPEKAPDHFIKGTVEGIQNGKDGYTAKIKTEDNETYFVTVSTANLSDPTQYKAVEIGSVIEVQGDEWTMGEDKQITVRQMK
ncbi:hypothetical protein CRP01_32250 [Flavilitoribacter nigricans DSM 23189 = NBRC 102662]|uniref:DUF5666 domain-containing protein n=2 Tax=Flavilitoribacter TaxID=2762562 RepID=A0A2D0N1S7_FLAN2|nr:hypothetical protein CRP01_32250 [Flavilitoribacter nigricans DSM 23189 = NBRC 102662]